MPIGKGCRDGSRYVEGCWGFPYLLIGLLVSWFLGLLFLGFGFLASCCCGFLVFGLLVSRLLGFKVHWFHSFLVSWFQAFEVQRLHVAILPKHISCFL